MIKELKNLKKLKVKENDIVIIRFDYSIPKEQLNSFIKYIVEKYSTIKFIAIPNTVTIESMSLENLIDMRNKLDDYIKEYKNNE
jgi:hypothetical protein